jgi:hypothetical protein
MAPIVEYNIKLYLYIVLIKNDKYNNQKGRDYLEDLGIRGMIRK